MPFAHFPDPSLRSPRGSGTWTASRLGLGACSALLFWLLAGPVWGQQPEPHRFELQSERVVVFKDGYCLIIKRGTATTDAAGMAFTEEVPDAAVLGSFWASATKGKIESMTAGWQDVEDTAKKDLTCTQTIDVVAANVGKSCEFLINQTRVKGEILQVLTMPTEQAIDDGLQRSLQLQRDPFSSSLLAGSVPTIQRNQGDQFVVRTETGDMLVSASSIQQLLIDDMNTTLERTLRKKSRQKRLRWQFDAPNQPVEIVLTYFRPGIRWIPAYRVDLQAAATPVDPVNPAANVQTKATKGQTSQPAAASLATVSLQAELINEAEDLIDVPIDVVVGVPNFRFRDTPSPLVLEAKMRNALASAAPQLMGQQVSNQFSNSMYSQRSSESRGGSGMMGREGNEAAIDMPAELSGENSQDLFVYHLQRLTLKKGERASLPILTTKVRYRDVYTWDIQLKHTETFSPSGSTEQSPLVLSENKVWRQVELINDTRMPWTTGAAMFVEGSQPLAQELLTYTSPGSQCRIPVTVAVDLRGRVEDRETGRKAEKVLWRGHHYTRVDGKIDIELENNKQGAVPVEVRLRFGGKADSATADGTIRLNSFRNEDWDNYRGEPAVNNSSQVTWKATVASGECFRPEVNYHFYLRH